MTVLPCGMVPQTTAIFPAEIEAKFTMYNIRQFYDKLDATYTNSPSKANH